MRGAELSIDHPLVVIWIHRQERKLERLGRPIAFVRFCCVVLVEPSVRDHVPLLMQLFGTVAERSPVSVLPLIPEPGVGHQT